MTVRLWKTERVLRTIAEGVFEDEHSDLLFRLDMESWTEMGHPETITVTIEPGDQLNRGGP